MRSFLQVFFLFSLLLFSGCRPNFAGKDRLVKKIDSEEMSKLVINFSAKMKKDKHLELESSGVSYEEYIKKVCLKYSSQRLLTVYEARLLMVELAEEFLHRLNNNTIVGFELEHYPFTAKDLDVQINFENFYGRYVDELYVGLARLKEGNLHFYAFDYKDEKSVDCAHKRVEPYSKSRELALLKQQADLPFIDGENPPKKPSEYLYDRYVTPSL